jgi:hypothetical protein
MKTLKGLMALCALGVGSAAFAHPTDIAFETRGKCEAAYAESSKLDRERLVDTLGVFETYGAAQRTFNERFSCEYDEGDGVWYIVDHLFG